MCTDFEFDINRIKSRPSLLDRIVCHPIGNKQNYMETLWYHLHLVVIGTIKIMKAMNFVWIIDYECVCNIICHIRQTEKWKFLLRIQLLRQLLQYCSKKMYHDMYNFISIYRFLTLLYLCKHECVGNL